MPDDPRMKRPIVRLAMNRAEIAMSIGVSIASVDKMVAEGVLPKPRRWHSRKLWLVSEVEAHLNELPVDGEDDASNALDQWRANKGPGGYPVPEPGSALAKYYARMGFDPLKMDANDYSRLQAQDDEKWRIEVLAAPLGKRERAVLKHLASFELGTRVDSIQIKPLHFETQQRLELRGFIEVHPNPRGENRPPLFILTAAGMSAWAALSAVPNDTPGNGRGGILL